MSRLVRASIGVALAAAVLAPSAASAICTVTLEERRFACGQATCSATFPVITCPES